jgi:hypothetical protein
MIFCILPATTMFIAQTGLRPLLEAMTDIANCVKANFECRRRVQPYLRQSFTVHLYCEYHIAFSLLLYQMFYYVMLLHLFGHLQSALQETACKQEWCKNSIVHDTITSDCCLQETSITYNSLYNTGSKLGLKC